MLETLLTTQLFAWILVFARVGTAMSLLPGFGDSYVPVRVRLLFALAVSAVVTPVLGDRLPPLPATVGELFLLIGGEILVGAFLGTITKMLMSALDVAGMVISSQISLANAFVLNPMMAAQGSLVSAFLGIMGLTLIFVTDLHHLLLLAVVDSYSLFMPGAPLPFGDFGDMMAELLSRSFSIGMRIAAPFLVAGLLFYLALGLLNRLMPQIQVFFIAMPAQIGLGLLLLVLTLSAGMLFWLRGFEQTVYGFLDPV